MGDSWNEISEGEVAGNMELFFANVRASSEELRAERHTGQHEGWTVQIRVLEFPWSLQRAYKSV